MYKLILTVYILLGSIYAQSFNLTEVMQRTKPVVEQIIHAKTIKEFYCDEEQSLYIYDDSIVVKFDANKKCDYIEMTTNPLNAFKQVQLIERAYNSFVTLNHVTDKLEICDQLTNCYSIDLVVAEGHEIKTVVYLSLDNPRKR